MAAWIASGRVLDVILVGMVLEGVVLAALWRRRRQGVAPGILLPNLLSGMCLLLAMRLGLAGAWFGWIGLALLGALACHVADVKRNWASS